VFALVAGVMVDIPLDERCRPRASRAGHQVLGGLLAGMA
jgi:hypothetical protein